MTAPAPQPAPSPGAFAPFATPAFAVLWTATVISNIGTWMSSAASGWLMTELGASPFIVSSVQAASAAPLFLFALLAGALADIFDKRRLLILMQCLMGSLAAGFAVLVTLNAVTPPVLLAFTFLLATGGAFVAPAWQAIVPKLVDRPLLPQAVALNSMGINVSRAIGPALAGLLIATSGMAAPFLLDAASYIAVIAALVWWRMPQKALGANVPSEHVAGAIVAGMRYAANSRALQVTLIRACGFFLFASAPMSLLPLIARQQLHGNVNTFGFMMGAVGGGAVMGALLLPRFKARLGANGRIVLGTVFVACASAGLALATQQWQGVALAALFGLGWIAVLSALNTAAQFALPDWVRARGLAIFSTVFFGAMTAGSLIWGQVATHAGLPTALLAASALSIVAVVLLAAVKVDDAVSDLTPLSHWPEPILGAEVEIDRGPIMVTVNYIINPAVLPGILKALAALEPARRRGGATAWGVFQDAADPTRLVEYFQEESWAEHLRHHARVTKIDLDLQNAVEAFHCGSAPPLVTHWIAPHPDAAPAKPAAFGRGLS